MKHSPYPAWSKASSVQARTHSPAIEKIVKRSQNRKVVRSLAIGLTLLALWLYAPVPFKRYDELRCRSLPGSEDTLVIMKTGVTELEDRMPPHFENDLKCPPTTLVFSDHKEIMLNIDQDHGIQTGHSDRE